MDAPTKLRVWMARIELSAKELAAKLNCSDDHVTHLRKGRTVPSLHEAHEMERLSGGDVPAVDWLKPKAA